MAQHDYIIANQSGAGFRADLNNALAAIVSNNSGATAPATTYAYMPWADTTTGLFKIRNGANSAWITLYQLDGEWSTIALENGTAAAPSLYFKDSGTDTGLFSAGTDQVNIATAGVERLTCF
jgi:flagellar basal body rod protein FlgF